MKKGAFVSIYGVFLLAFLGACAGTFFVLSPKMAISHIFAREQANLYAKGMADIALACIKEFGVGDCALQQSQFGAFNANASLTILGDLLLLDVYVQVQNPVTSNIQNVTHRYILLKP